MNGSTHDFKFPSESEVLTPGDRDVQMSVSKSIMENLRFNI